MEVELRHLDSTLRDARRILNSAPEAGLLTSYRPMSEATRPELGTLMGQMLAEIVLLVTRFELKTRADDVGNHVSAEMSAAWSDLHGILSYNLKRSGDVDQALSETLDPHVQRLIALAHQIANLTRA